MLTRRFGYGMMIMQTTHMGFSGGNGMLDFIMQNLPILVCFLFGLGMLIVEVFMPGFGLPGSGALYKIL